MRTNKIYQPLDSEENELIESIRRDEWEEAKDVRKIKKQALEYAEATAKKDKRMNIRISERDLKNLKRKAMEEVIPYQTMVSMVLHKYLAGRFSERSS